MHCRSKSVEAETPEVFSQDCFRRSCSSWGEHKCLNGCESTKPSWPPIGQWAKIQTHESCFKGWRGGQKDVRGLGWVPSFAGQPLISISRFKYIRAVSRGAGVDRNTSGILGEYRALLVNHWSVYQDTGTSKLFQWVQGWTENVRGVG